MEAILDFNGWRKRVTLSTTAIESGRMRACVYEPIRITRLQPTDTVEMITVKDYLFEYFGYTEGGVRIFECTGK